MTTVARCWSVVVLCASTCVAAAAPGTPQPVSEVPLRVGVYHNPPKIALAAGDVPKGIYGEVLEHVQKRSGVRFEYVPVNFSEGLQALQKGDLGALVDVAKTPERARTFVFGSEPVLRTWGEIYVRRGIDVRNLTDLHGRTVAVLAGSVHEATLREEARAFGIALPLLSFPTLDEAFAAAKSGKADAVAADALVGQQKRGALLNNDLVFRYNELYFAFAPGTSPRLVAAFDEAVRELAANPSSAYTRELQSLVKGQRQERSPPWVLPAVAAAVALALVATGWAYTARRSARRTAAAEANARAAAAELQQIFDCSLDIISVLDDQLRFLKVSPALRRLGLEPNDVLGRRLTEMVAPADRGAVESRMERVRCGEPATSQPFQLVDASGTAVDASYSAVWVEDARRYCCILHDEAQLASLVRSLEDREQAMRDSNRELQLLAHTLAHDLRAPVAVVNNFLGVVLEKEGKGMHERSVDFLHRCQHACARMNEMLTDLSTMLRTSATDLEPDECNLSQLVEEIAKRLPTGDNPPQFVVEPSVRAMADLRLMKAALENLLGNAVKFSSKVPRPRVEFGMVYDQKDPVLFVRDNGAGFDSRYADKLFQPFTRLHSEQEFPGTGMGLSIVHRIVEKHGGKLWAESAPGAGATFYFTLKSPRHRSVTAAGA